MEVKNGSLNGVGVKKRSAMRKNLPQILTTFAFGLLILSVATISAMPTIVLGCLYKKNHNETDSEIPFTDQQASWFGSVVYIAQPLGSVTSGFIQDVFGRRRCMMFVSIPQVFGWGVLYFSESVAHLFTGAVILGLSIGFMEAPAMSYLGEVCEPRLRGTLSSFSEVFFLLGILFKFSLGAMLSWRYSCAVSALVPIAAFGFLYIVPESPTWYVLKGRDSDAEKALMWLRGWVKKEEIQLEMDALTSSINQGYTKVPNTDKNVPENLPQVSEKSEKHSEWAKLKLLRQGRIYRPIILILVYFFVGHSISLVGPRAFLVQIFEGFNTTVSPYTILVLSGLMQFTGSIICASLVHRVGKRVLMIVTNVGGILTCLLLAAYIHSGLNLPWVPILLFCLNFFCGGLGIMTLPWILISEIFCLEAKGFSAGFVAAASYVFMFIVSKSYLDLAHLVNLEGAFFVYGSVGLIGFVYLYFRQPETEGKTLAEIELYFQDKRNN